MSNVPSTEDRIWAVISHLSAIAFGMGILLPVIGWAEQRRKSNYASFQCLQALGFQSLGFTIWALSSALVAIIIAIFILIVLGRTSGNSENPYLLVTFWISILGVFIFILGIYFVLPIFAAISCGLGRDFRYPFLGDRLARYLKYDSTKDEWLNEDHEHRWVAAMGHFAVIIALWGMLAPLTAWFTQAKQDLFLKIQSIQTLLFQAFVTLSYFAAVIVYVLGFFLLLATIGVTGTPDIGSLTGMLGVLLFFMSLLIAFVIILAIPLMHILGQWAGYRVLKGDDYRYPLIGKLVEGWISKQANSIIEEKPT